MKWWRSRNTDSEDQDQDETDGKPLFRWERDYNMGKYQLELITFENIYLNSLLVLSLLAKMKYLYL